MTRDEKRPRRDAPPKRRPPKRDLPPSAAPLPKAARPTMDGAAATPAKPQRIAKLMARAGLCSRREAEAWIIDGRVSVNGATLQSPAMDVGPQDRILVDGAPLPTPEKTRLFLFHKPRGLVTSDHDPEGRPTVADFLRENWPEGPRTVTIGRLDINTEGLLLLTNDGGLARVLELPQTGWVRRYRVRAKGATDQSVLDSLAAGVSIDGMDYAGIEAKLDRIQGSNCWLTMGLREGKNREVKRVLEHIGLEVNRLIRLSFGPFQLLELPEGAVEEVRTRVLRDQLGEALAAQAGVDFSEPAAPEVRPPRDERPARPPRDQRDGPRSMSRDRPAPDQPPALRERPQAGTRKHVSALRAKPRQDEGPRKRIERGKTEDRRARTITVERLVTPPRSIENGPPRRSRADGGGRNETPGARPKRGRDGVSPSALGKRERIARSGGRRRDEGSAERADTRSDTARPSKPARFRKDGERRNSFGDGPQTPRPPGRDARRSDAKRTGPGEDRKRNSKGARPTREGRPPRDRQKPGGSGKDGPKGPPRATRGPPKPKR